MKEHELVVVGGGTANNVAAAAADEGIDTALIEKGPLGGTCLNRGCNPSKMLIQAANVAEEVRGSGRFGVESSLDGIDFAGVIEEMDATLSGLADGMEESYRAKEDLTMYNEVAEFVGERTLEVGGEKIRGEKVVVAAGSRPLVPPIDGLEEVEYLTSTEALYLDEAPDSLVVMGGGYIAVELGYFFEAMGTDVRVVEMMDSLVPREDSEVSEAFTEIARDRHDVYTGHRATSVEEDGEGVVVRTETEDGKETTVRGEKLLVALGRRPNTDKLGVEKAGIETDENGFVKTNEYLETSAENVWAQGDIADNAMFKHSGDYETEKTIANVVGGRHESVDFSAMPHAIFTEPQIAGVGATEDELRDDGIEYSVGKARYADSAMGRAKKLEHGFAKVLVSDDGDILGCHMIGEEASVMIHQAVVAMRNGVTADEVADTIHAHPTLSRVVESAFEDAAL
jgi:dihydrolipoamide dehydrogenase